MPQLEDKLKRRVGGGGVVAAQGCRAPSGTYPPVGYFELPEFGFTNNRKTRKVNFGF
jgi:hypothetical protein